MLFTLTGDSNLKVDDEEENILLSFNPITDLGPRSSDVAVGAVRTGLAVVNAKQSSSSSSEKYE